MSIFQMRDAEAAVVFQAALRADLLIGIALCSLAAMSAFQNEFRFQTIWQTAREPRTLSRLMVARAVVMVIITLPALCVPFVVAGFATRGQAIPTVGRVLVALALVLTAYTHILTLALSVTYDPARVVPWIRQITMAVLVGAVVFLSPLWLRQLFPFHWMEQMALSDDWRAAAWTLILTLFWWMVSVIVLRRPSATVLDARLTDNVEQR